MSRNWILHIQIFLFCSVSFVLSQNLSRDHRLLIEKSQKLKKSEYSAGLAKLFSFGHIPTVVDWYLVKGLGESSYLSKGDNEHPPLFYDIELISRLDPLFFDAYYVGVSILTVIQKDYDGAMFLIKRSNEIYNRQVKSMSSKFQNFFWNGSQILPMYQGYIELFANRDYQKAAAAFTDAGERPGAGGYFKSFAQRLKSKSELYQYGIKFLTSLIKKEEDELMKKNIIHQREELYLLQYYEDLNQDFKDFIVTSGGRKSQNISITDKGLIEIRSFLKKYLDSKHLSNKDPWGYSLGIDQNGRIHRN